MMSFALAFLAPFALAFSLTRLSFRNHTSGPYWASVLLQVFVTIGLGLGICSCTFFLWLAFVGQPGQGFVLAETVIFCGLAVSLLYFAKASQHDRGLATPSETKQDLWIRRILLTGFLVTLATRLIRFVVLSRDEPHGDVDAWFVWNLRARFLFSGGDEWMESFGALLTRSSTPDYPLLLPATIARVWSYMGDDSALVPSVMALVFTFAIVGLGWCSLTVLRSENQGWLTGLVLVGTPFLIKHGTAQYADVPLAFYMLAALVLLSLHDASRGSHLRLVTLAGMMAGFAAWTKNEGVLFLATLAFARMLVLVPTHGWAHYVRETKAFAIGVLPPVAIILYFKLQVVPAVTPMIAQGLPSIVEKVQDLSSYMLVGEALLAKLLRFGFPGVALLLTYAALLGIQRDAVTRGTIGTPILVLFGLLCGYILVIIITPFNSVQYQLSTAFDRLWLHLWPSIVMLFFLLVRTPEEFLGRTARVSRVQS